MISVTILTKNSEKHLKNVLTALTSFDEVLIGDTGSTDSTLDIAAKFQNVRIHHLPFTGFGTTHNALASLSKHPWILSVDSDEIPESLLVDEILSLPLDPQKVYSIPRKNYYKGLWIRTCGWYPDRVTRLYNRTTTHFSSALVHESIESKNALPLTHHLIHHPYTQINDFLTKMQLYTTLFATQYRNKKKSTTFTAISHGFFSFFRSYILKLGIIQGSPGLEISLYNGITAYYKYLKLAEINKTNK